MITTSPTRGHRPLSEREREVLQRLADLHVTQATTRRPQGWATPKDFGGTNHSHHSRTATNLARMGLLERRKHGIDGRGSCSYRITPKGLALAQPGSALPGGTASDSQGSQKTARLVSHHESAPA